MTVADDLNARAAQHLRDNDPDADADDGSDLFDRHRKTNGHAGMGRAGAGPRPAEPTATPSNLPEEFWTARPKLTLIRDDAHSALGSADAELGAVLARVVAATHHAYFLPGIVGARCSMNLYVALIGPSGSGKSSAVSRARDLIPIDDERIDGDLLLGSGEGLIEAFLDDVKEPGPDGKTVTVKRQVKDAVLAYMDEGATMADLTDRRGSTLGGILRTAWMGEGIGQSNAAADRRRRLERHAYRFCLVAGYQPETALALFSDAGRGTPQRYVWLASSDPTIPKAEDLPELDLTASATALDWAPLPVPAYAGMTIKTPIGFPREVVAEVRRDKADVNRGTVAVGQHDGHRNLGRMKIAAALAVLERRAAVDLEDWYLAGMVADVSRATCDAVGVEGRRVAGEKEHAQTAALDRRRSTIERSEVDESIDRMARTISRHVHKGCEHQPCTRACAATRATNPRDRTRASVDEAVEMAVERRWLVRDGKAFLPGTERPV